MVKVTRLDGKEYYVNPHQIEIIDCTPDTTLQMLSGKHLVVKEPFEELYQRIVAYRSEIGFRNEE